MKRLLILSCSASKRSDPPLLRAIERYTGVAHAVLHRYLRDHQDPELHVVIRSATYGLITAQKLIPWYDQAMTSERALALQPRVQQRLFCVLQRFGPYGATCIHLGRIYPSALDITPARIPQLGAITVTSGGIGMRLGQLKRWLYSH